MHTGSMLTQIFEILDAPRPRRSIVLTAGLALLAAAITAGCGPIEILEGGTRATLPKKSKRVYRVTECTLTKKLQKVKLPGL